MKKYKKYLTTYRECMFCHEADCSKLITFKSQFVTPDRSFTTCKNCCEKLDIINNTDKYENLVDKLRHDYHEWNKDADDIYVDIYVEVVSYPRILSKDEYYYVTYNLVWKDEEDVEHKQECGSYSSVEDVIFEIKDTFEHSCYLYVFNIHYEKENPFQNRVFGYLECLIDKAFILSKTNQVQIKESEKKNKPEEKNYRNYRER